MEQSDWRERLYLRRRVYLVRLVRRRHLTVSGLTNFSRTKILSYRRIGKRIESTYRRIFSPAGKLKKRSWKMTVTTWIHVEVVLVKFLSEVETTKRKHFNEDFSGQGLLLFSKEILNHFPIGHIGIEHTTAILSSYIFSLTVKRCRINRTVKPEWNRRRVITCMHSLGKTAQTGLDVVIRRIKISPFA